MDNQIDLVIQPIQAPNQTLYRKLAHAPSNKRRYVRLLQTKHRSSLGLRQLASLDDLADFANELCLEKLFFRIGKAKIGKDIATAEGHLVVLAHLLPPKFAR